MIHILMIKDEKPSPPRRVWDVRHLLMAGLWALLAIPTVLWWKDAIVWVALMSIYANVEASVAAYNAQKDESPPSKAQRG